MSTLRKFPPVAVALFAFFSCIMYGQVNAVRAEVPYFTNEDIEKYGKAGTGSRIEEPGGSGMKKEMPAHVRQKKEGEYWCRKAISYRKRIEKEREDVQEAERLFDELKDIKSKKKKSAERRVEKAKKLLMNAEKDLSEFEDEAHRKEIPPGWLRCQFDW